MESVFISRKPAPKTKETRKISRLAKRVNSSLKSRHAPSACIVTTYIVSKKD